MTLEQVFTLATYPGAPTSPPLQLCMPLLRRKRQLYDVALFDEQVLVVSLSSQFSVFNGNGEKKKFPLGKILM